jgi:superfamily II DNA or RNA helicase
MMATATPFEFWPDGIDTRAAGPVLRGASTPARSAPRPPRDELADWNYWLRELENRDRMAQPQVADAERSFGVLLRGATNNDVPQLLINMVWLRPGRSRGGITKHGTLVDPQPLLLDYRRGPLPTPDGGWPIDVVPALALLLHDQHTQAVGQSWVAIHADHQEQALATLLTHYPAYHERGSEPLMRGETLPLQLQWTSRPDGSQKLHASVASESPVQLLRGARLWYVLPKQQRYGLVDGDPELVTAVANAPAAQPEQASALRQRLQSMSAARQLPLPEVRKPPEVFDEAPVPVLQLRVVPTVSTRGKAPAALGIARLAFDYGDVRLQRDEPSSRPRRLLGERLIQINRQLDQEKHAADQLRAAGLSTIGWHPDARQVKASDLVLKSHPAKPPLPASEWQPLIDKLTAAGFRIDYADDFPRQRQVEIDEWHGDITAAGNQWFDVTLGIDVGGERIDLLPLLRRMLSDPAFPLVPPKREKKNASWRVALDEMRSVEIPLSRLRALIEPLLEWLQGDGELRLHRTRAETLASIATAAQMHWHGGDILRAQLELLRHATRDAKPPRGFKATLRPYQCEGLAWLNFLGNAGLGGILADDMGLGKTVQVLAHILAEKQRGRLKQPALVVAPTSLVSNWRDESARFAPGLKVLVLHGPQRADVYPMIAQHNVVITSYPLLPRDEERLREARFSLLVLDEAQAIKNPRSQAAQVVRSIPAARRLAMTGTPLENHLGELWAQFDAVEPGLLGSERQFTKLYRTPIEKHGDSDRQQRLNRRIGALLLRRRKQDVLTDLPDKTEIVHRLELEDQQRNLYETLRLAQHQRVQQAVKERGLSQSGIIVLDALLKLRQACCDPRLVKLPSARRIKQSAKLDALLELLDGLLAEGRRVLLFSQFTEMLALIEGALQKRKIAHQTLTGQTTARERSALVKRFQAGDVPVFLISLKAGGVGLNLTAADTVIHYDPWWNPAVEAQATDRAHRIGQDKAVFVYRLICTGTVEEKIQALQARKADLAQAVLDGGGASQRLRFDEKDLAELFAPM